MSDKQVDSFMKKFFGFAAASSVLALIYAADRAGVFTAMAHAGPLTVEQLAKRSGLNIRYLQEILSAFACAGIVNFDPSQNTFELPDAHAFVLADDHVLNSVGMSQIIHALHRVSPKVAEAIKNGGGVSFAEFQPDFVEGMARSNSPGMKYLLVRKWLPAIPGLIPLLKKGIRVADVGCGSGAAVLAMAKAFPNSLFVGIDVDEVSIRKANEHAKLQGLQNVEFMHANGESLPEAQFDFIITFDVIHDVAEPVKVLSAIRKALRKNGLYVMVEPQSGENLEENIKIGMPMAMLYSISTLHCMTQSLANHGEGLGAAWGQSKAEEYCKKAGFAEFRRLPVVNMTNAFYEVRETPAAKL